VTYNRLPLESCSKCGGPRGPYDGKTICLSCNATRRRAQYVGNRPHERALANKRYLNGGKAKNAARRLANPEKHRAWNKASRTRRIKVAPEIFRASEHRRKCNRYGITDRQYELMLQMKGGGCWICGALPKKRRLAIEHDHATGRVRGLACHNCNRHLIGKNNAGTARRVLAYLEDNFDGRLI